MDISAELSRLTATRTHHLHQGVALCGELQDTLQASAVKSHDYLIAYDDNRSCLLPCRCEQGVASFEIYRDIPLRKRNPMVGKKLFHVLACASQGR